MCFGEIDTTLRGHDSRFDTTVLLLLLLYFYVGSCASQIICDRILKFPFICGVLYNEMHKISVKPRVMTPQSSVNFPKTHLKRAKNSGKQYKKRVLRAVFALLAAPIGVGQQLSALPVFGPSWVQPCGTMPGGWTAAAQTSALDVLGAISDTISVTFR